MARFFIDRPVFAMVIAIVIVILGCVVIPTLPIATYPEVVPPVVQITAVYQGGNATDLEKTVSQPIEQQLTGLDGMLYYFARASNNGTLTIDVTFELGTDPDLATVKVQNKVSVALPLLPPEVQRVGVTTKKVSSSFLLFVALTAPDNRYDTLFLNNYAAINLVDKIGSLAGVGNSVLAGAQNYSMRVWINPDKMAKLGLTATDINNAIQAQNRQNPAGSLGQPPGPRGTRLSVSGQRFRPADDSSAVRGHRRPSTTRWLAAARSGYRPCAARRARLLQFHLLERPRSRVHHRLPFAGRERGGNAAAGREVHAASEREFSGRARIQDSRTTLPAS